MQRRLRRPARHPSAPPAVRLLIVKADGSVLCTPMTVATSL